MKLDEIANSLKMQPDQVLQQKIQAKDPLDSAIAAALLQQRQEQRAAAAPQQVAPIAQQPPVAQGLFPVIAQAAQQLMQQRAMAPQGGLRTVEQPVQMASGGIVSFQQGGMPILNPRLRELLTSTPDTGDVDRLVAMEVDRELRANPNQDRAQLENRIRQQYVRPSFTPNVEGASPNAPRPTAQQAAEFFGLGSVAPRPTGNRPQVGPAGPRPTAPPPAATAPVGTTMPSVDPYPGATTQDILTEQAYAAAQPKPPVDPRQAIRERMALRKEFGADQPYRYRIEQLERAMARDKAEGPMRQMAAAAAGMSGRDLAGVLQTGRQAGYLEGERMRNAELLRETAIAHYRDAEAARAEGDIEKALAEKQAGEKAEQEYRNLVLQQRVSRGNIQAQVDQRAREAAMVDRRERELEAERRPARLREIAEQGRWQVAAAKAGREGTLDTNKMRIIVKEEQDYIEKRSAADPSFAKLPYAEKESVARAAMMARYPQLYSEAVGAALNTAQGPIVGTVDPTKPRGQQFTPATQQR